MGTTETYQQKLVPLPKYLPDTWVAIHEFSHVLQGTWGCTEAMLIRSKNYFTHNTSGKLILPWQYHIIGLFPLLLGHKLRELTRNILSRGQVEEYFQKE